MYFHPKVLEQKEKIGEYISSLGFAISEKNLDEIILLAFVHKSFAADYKESYDHNERLEFLGDGILGACINKILFLEHPEMPESELTLYKIAFVREEMLAEVARDIKLGEQVFISNGEEKMNGRNKNSILSDTLEAIIGATYLSLGRESIETFIKKYLYSKFKQIDTDPVKSYKTMVQEFVQQQYKIIPDYKDIEHSVEKTGNVTEYRSEIWVLGHKKAEGFGASKKKAQESAAKNYYSLLITGNFNKND